MYSKTYLAEIVKFISVLALIFGFEVDENVLMMTVTGVAFIASQAYTLWLRYKLGGINGLGFRKK